MENQNTQPIEPNKKFNPNTNVEEQVRATEDASLQDDSYSFDEDNTSNEDIHDVSDFGSEGDLFDSQEDYS
jgi:hypothetical protein